MKPREIIHACRDCGAVLLTDGERIGIRGCIPFPLLQELRAHKREILDCLRPKATPPLPAWVVTDENLREVVPGSPERQDFRRRVIDIAGLYWHPCPVSIRESILSRHLPARDHLAAASEIMRFMGRGK